MLPLEARETATPGVVLPITSTVLTEPDVAEYPEQMGFGDDLYGVEAATERRDSNSCRYIPGDAKWPSDSDWSVLESFVGKCLVKPDPFGKVCFPGSAYDAGKCATVIAEFTNSDLQ